MAGRGACRGENAPGEQRSTLLDVAAEINDLERGAGFVLFIKKGRINMLEGYTYGEPWPQNVHSFHLYYDGTSERE
jgi:hypothetical protein